MRRVLFLIAVLGGFAAAFAGAASAATSERIDGLLPLGSPAPHFSLPEVTTGRTVTLKDFEEKKALMVVFICRHCPYVQHVKGALAQLGREYQSKGAAIVAISANDPGKVPGDAPESLAEMAKEEGFTFPFLFDETQRTAQAYTAVATPDVFVFDGARKLVYRGQFDDSRPFGKGKASGEDARAAIDSVLEGKPAPFPQKPAVGCSIKWKPGNEPPYLG
jgi:peroxiredoxin